MSLLKPTGKLFPENPDALHNSKGNTAKKVEIDVKIDEKAIKKEIDETMKRIIEKLNSK